VSTDTNDEIIRRARAARARSQEVHLFATPTHLRAADLHYHAAEFQDFHAEAERKLGRHAQAKKMEGLADRARARARTARARALN